MGQIARVVVPGYPHHITQRGNRRQQTFFCEEDYRAYLDLMSEWCSTHGEDIQAYCLMPLRFQRSNSLLTVGRASCPSFLDRRDACPTILCPMNVTCLKAHSYHAESRASHRLPEGSEEKSRGQRGKVRSIKYGVPGTTELTWTAAEVRCFAGYKADERPTGFRVGHREIEVVKILASWREPDHLCFKVEAPDGIIYELRHHEYEDRWQVRESRGQR